MDRLGGQRDRGYRAPCPSGHRAHRLRQLEVDGTWLRAAAQLHRHVPRGCRQDRYRLLAHCYQRFAYRWRAHRALPTCRQGINRYSDASGGLDTGPRARRGFPRRSGFLKAEITDAPCHLANGRTASDCLTASGSPSSTPQTGGRPRGPCACSSTSTCHRRTAPRSSSRRSSSSEAGRPSQSPSVPTQMAATREASASRCTMGRPSSSAAR